jgi:cytochrome c oxidase assembly protein subunit 15
MIHACTAQAFLCLTVMIAAALSPAWIETPSPAPVSRAVGPLSWLLVAAVFCQLMIGAVMRHLHAGLSIPDFPLAFGRLIPPLTDERVAIHFAHRVGALVVTLLIIALVSVVFATARSHARLTRAAAGLLAAIVLQITLGAYVIWTHRSPEITSFHVVNGAIVLGVALLLAMRVSRLKALPQPESEGWRQYQQAHA